MEDKKRWVAKWEESDITIASSDSRRGLLTNLKNFLDDHYDDLKGKEVTIKLFEVRW